MKATIPLVIGAIPFGIIFGTLASANGLSLQATMAMSLFVFAGSAQFIAVGLIALGTTWPIIVATTFFVNLRHLLYSAALLPLVRAIPHLQRAPLAFTLTDETFAVVMSHQSKMASNNLNKWFYFGSASFMYTNWQLCTFVGVTLDEFFPRIANWGLDFAMPVTFIGMLIPYLTKRPMWLAVIVAGIVSIVAHPLPHKLGLILAALSGIAIGILAEFITNRKHHQ